MLRIKVRLSVANGSTPPRDPCRGMWDCGSRSNYVQSYETLLLEISMNFYLQVSMQHPDAGRF